jgi:AcrR family transcriptional regulator
VLVSNKGSRLKDRYRATVRGELADVASELFLTEGYDPVTLDRVARESGVSIRTVLRYFQTKDQLALARHFDALEEFQSKLESSERDLDTIAFWRDHIKSHAVTLEDDGESWRRHLELIETVPALTAAFLKIMRSYEDLLRDALAGDAGLAAPDLRCRLVAATLVSANLAAMRHWLAEPRTSLRELGLAAVDFAASASLSKGGLPVSRVAAG